MAEDQSSTGETHPQPDPTLAKIDLWLLRLTRWRELLIEIGDPREEAAGATVRVKKLLEVLMSDEAPPDTVAAALAEQPMAVARDNVLWPAAHAREKIESAVDRLHRALLDPEPSEEEIRDRIARYLDTLINKLRLGKRVEKLRLEARGRTGETGWTAVKTLLTPESMADHMIAALKLQFPAYGRRLEQHRTELVDRMAKLQIARGRGRPRSGGRTHAALKAEDLRQEILGWLFQTATAGAIKARRSRERKK
jgi:hypothetical protein